MKQKDRLWWTAFGLLLALLFLLRYCTPVPDYTLPDQTEKTQ